MNAIAQKLMNTIVNVASVQVVAIVANGMVELASEKNVITQATANTAHDIVNVVAIGASVAIVAECVATIVSGNSQAQADAIASANAQALAEDAEWDAFMAMVMPSMVLGSDGNYYAIFA